MMFAGLEIGHFLTKPITEVIKGRVDKALWAKYEKAFKAVDEKLAKEQGELAEMLKNLEAGKPVDAEKFYAKIESLWKQRGQLLEQMNKGEMPKALIEEALKAHAEQAAKLELVFAEMGVDAHISPERAFRPIAPGLVV